MRTLKYYDIKQETYTMKHAEKTVCKEQEIYILKNTKEIYTMKHGIYTTITITEIHATAREVYVTVIIIKIYKEQRSYNKKLLEKFQVIGKFLIKWVIMQVFKWVIGNSFI